MVGRCKDTLRLGAAGKICGWSLRGHLVVGHCRDAMRLGPAIRLWAECEDNIDIDFKI